MLWDLMLYLFAVYAIVYLCCYDAGFRRSFSAVIVCVLYLYALLKTVSCSAAFCVVTLVPFVCVFVCVFKLILDVSNEVRQEKPLRFTQIARGACLLAAVSAVLLLSWWCLTGLLRAWLIWMKT